MVVSRTQRIIRLSADGNVDVSRTRVQRDPLLVDPVSAATPVSGWILPCFGLGEGALVLRVALRPTLPVNIEDEPVMVIAKEGEGFLGRAVAAMVAETFARSAGEAGLLGFALGEAVRFGIICFWDGDSVVGFSVSEGSYTWSVC